MLLLVEMSTWQKHFVSRGKNEGYKPPWLPLRVLACVKFISITARSTVPGLLGILLDTLPSFPAWTSFRSVNGPDASGNC